MDKIYDFWKNNSNLWFNSTPDNDKYIYDNFKHYLLNNYNKNASSIFIEHSKKLNEQ